MTVSGHKHAPDRLSRRGIIRRPGSMRHSTCRKSVEAETAVGTKSGEAGIIHDWNSDFSIDRILASLSNEVH
jgi:hypothetical protein